MADVIEMTEHKLRLLRRERDLLRLQCRTLVGLIDDLMACLEADFAADLKIARPLAYWRATRDRLVASLDKLAEQDL